jgi:hypothetical protein
MSALTCPQGVMDGYQLVLILVFSVLAFRTACQLSYDHASDKTMKLSRRKRYLVFPDGSTFSVSDKS